MFRECADSAMALFASTSPSYLILGSLDRANAVMADGFPELIAGCAGELPGLKADCVRTGLLLFRTSR